MEAEGREPGGGRIDMSLLPLKKRVSNARGSNPDDSSLIVAPQPPEKKLMHDGIGSFTQPKDPEALAADETKEDQSVATPRPRSRSPPCPPDDARVYADDDLGEVLRRRLAELGATRPWIVHKKTLHKSDVCPNQNRLLVSCKRGTLRRCPITGCFSPAERERVRNKHVGLFVTALDRDGVPHQLTCKFLSSNSGYRFISGWKAFLSRNGMELDSSGAWRRDVEVELRAFRSRALPLQPQLDAEGKPIKKKTDEEKVDEHGRKVEEYVQVPDHLDEDGSLGLILLHHEHRREPAKHEEEEDDKGMARPAPAARDKGKKKKKKREKRDEAVPAAAAAASSSPASGAEPGEAGLAESMSKAEMVDKYGDYTTKALIGVMMLRGGAEGGDMSKESKEGNDDVDGGHCA